MEAPADVAVASQALAASGVIRWRLDAPVQGTALMATEKGAPVIVERRAL
jgi:hypothetical protein